MRPTARAIWSGPLGPVPRAIWAAKLANATSVACSRSSRLRARSSANSGFLQTTFLQTTSRSQTALENPASCAREETRESRGMPCLFLNTERGFGGKPPQKSGYPAGVLHPRAREGGFFGAQDRPRFDKFSHAISAN